MSVLEGAGQGPLPKGWRWARLGEVCKPEKTLVEPNSEEACSLPYLGLEHVEPESGRILDAYRGIEGGVVRSTTYAFDCRHVLYGKLRPYLNKVALPDFAGRCTTELIPLLPTGADRAYLAWLLRRSQTVEAAMREKTGSRMPRADVSDLLRLAVPLPPLAEQRRIASVLNAQMAAAERARAAAERELEEARALGPAFLRAAFDGPEARKWPVVRLGDVCEFRHGGTPSKSEPTFWEGDIPWVSPKDMKSAVLCETADHISDEAVSASTTEVVPSGTLLMVVRSGILARHLPVSVLGKSAAFNQDIKALKPDLTRLDSRFLWAALVAREPLILTDGVKKGATVHSVKSGFIESLRLGLPSLVEQQEFVARWDDWSRCAGEIVAAAQARLVGISTLPQVLLREAFAGRV